MTTMGYQPYYMCVCVHVCACMCMWYVCVLNIKDYIATCIAIIAICIT